MQRISVDKQTVQRTWALVKPFFFSEIRWKARGLLVLLTSFSLTLTAVNVLMSYVNREFMTALSLKEQGEFIKYFYLYLLTFGLATPIVAFYRFTEERFGVVWRRWLSCRILERYFQNNAYYRLNLFEGIDNPDQRLEEDVRSFTSGSLSIFLICLNSIITIFAFMGILWSIDIDLVIAVLLYALFGTVVTYYFGRPLMSFNFAQLKKEADYRYKLVNIRDNAESIALYRDEKKEFARTRQQLKVALNNLILIIARNRNLNFFTTSYNYVIGVLPVIVVARLYLNGQIEFGVVVQAASAFVQVVNALSLIVLNFGSISSLVAVITRLGTFSEALEQAQRETVAEVSKIRLEDGEVLSFKGVTVLSPKRDQTIISRVDFDVPSGGLLITGSSGAGKSSLVRVIAGIWTAGVGRVRRPPPGETIFLPQRPYTIIGSFRSQLTYGTGKIGVTDKELNEVVEQALLQDTMRRIGGLGVTLNWPNFLSTGEQQKIGFARFLIAKPRYIVLDEAVAALDEDSQAYFYKLISSRTDLFVSVGYQASLLQFHKYLLELKGEGKWQFSEVQKNVT